MKETTQIDPAEIFNWIKKSVIHNQRINPNGVEVIISTSQTIEDFLDKAEWNDWDWVILIVALEVKFSIIIPEYYAANRNITFSEFVTTLSQFPVIKDSGHLYDRIKWFGDMILEIYLASKGESDEPNTIESLD